MYKGRKSIDRDRTESINNGGRVFFFFFSFFLLFIATKFHSVVVFYTGWPKSNVPKVRAYCSASEHLIRKIFSGVCRDIHWFEEYLKIIEIDDHFFE